MYSYSLIVQLKHNAADPILKKYSQCQSNGIYFLLHIHACLKLSHFIIKSSKKVHLEHIM